MCEGCYANALLKGAPFASVFGWSPLVLTLVASSLSICLKVNERIAELIIADNLSYFVFNANQKMLTLWANWAE